MTTVLPNGELQSNPKIAYNKGYKQGFKRGARDFAKFLIDKGIDVVDLSAEFQRREKSND